MVYSLWHLYNQLKKQKTLLHELRNICLQLAINKYANMRGIYTF